MNDYKQTRFSKVILILCAVIFICGTLSIPFMEDSAMVSTRAFQMFETALMMLIIFIPMITNRVMQIKISPTMEIAFVTFCFASLILGDVANFYSRFVWWDTILHAISGVLMGIVGYAIINTFNRVDDNRLRYSPLFVVAWIICFSLAVGAIWEILEFITDGLFGLNSQEFYASSGTFDTVQPRIGRDALWDTMVDLILDLCGAIIIAVVGYFDIRRQKKRINKSEVL